MTAMMMSFEAQLDRYGCYTSGEPWRLLCEIREPGWLNQWDPDLGEIWREWIADRSHPLDPD